MTAPKDWSAATFEGAGEHQRRAAAATSPAHRLAWLEQALRLAEASGALARVRRDRQVECELAWGDVTPDA
ncbi:MAG: hypothetical protein KY451_15030 [Actinobacteria bacterium]|nr:hypothetical protein [Actinomycetota bacterium]MBW3648667.1 hypothetical protein [Actinomycetota bacterium]